MSMFELLPLTVPAVVIVGVAIRLATRARRCSDVVVDLRDVPSVRLAPAQHTPAHVPPHGPVRGALVEPAGTGTLGARLRSVTGGRVAGPVPSHADAGTGSARTPTAVVRRRRRPLVALSRETPTG